MRLLVISDVHADAGALERVLDHSRQWDWEEVLFLGDAVGYGREPRATLELLRSLPLAAGLEGNHEAMLGELRRGRRPNAGRAITETLASHLESLSDIDLAFIDALEDVHLAADWCATHGALRERFEYVVSVPAARANAAYLQRDVCFVGHTHVPAAFIAEREGEWRVRSFTGTRGVTTVPRGAKAFLNPGSVSLPRDRGPVSSYGLFDTEAREFEVFRLP